MFLKIAERDFKGLIPPLLFSKMHSIVLYYQKGYQDIEVISVLPKIIRP